MKNVNLEAEKKKFLKQINNTSLLLLGVELRYLFNLRSEWRKIELNGETVGGINAQDIPNRCIDTILEKSIESCIKSRLLQEPVIMKTIVNKFDEEIDDFSTMTDDEKMRTINNIANWLYVNHCIRHDIKYGYLKTDLEDLSEEMEIEELESAIGSILEEPDPETEDLLAFKKIEKKIASILDDMNATEMLTVLELAEVEDMADDEILDMEIYNNVFVKKIPDISEIDLLRYFEDMSYFQTEFENLKQALKERLLKTDGFMAPVYLAGCDENDSELKNFLIDISKKRDLPEMMSVAVEFAEDEKIKEKVIKNLNEFSKIQFLIFILELQKLKIDDIPEEILEVIKNKLNILTDIDIQALRKIYAGEIEQNEIRALLMGYEDKGVFEEQCQKRIEQFELLGAVKQSFPILTYTIDNKKSNIASLIEEDSVFDEDLTEIEQEELEEAGYVDYYDENDEFDDVDENDELDFIDKESLEHFTESFYKEMMLDLHSRERTLQIIRDADMEEDQKLVNEIIRMAQRVDNFKLSMIPTVGVFDFSVKYLCNRILYMDKKNVMTILFGLMGEKISDNNVFKRTAELAMQMFKELNTHPGNGDGR